MAAGIVVILILATFLIHTFIFFWNHIYYMDGQNYVLYERLWFFKWVKKTMALPPFGRTFTIPLISRVKTDSTGKLIQFSQLDIKEMIKFTNIFKNNSAIVNFSFYIDYKIMDINKFIIKNDLNTNPDHSVFLSEIKANLKKQFEKQKLLTTKTDPFQQWANSVKNEFDFSKYGVVCSKIVLDDAVMLFPLHTDPKCINEGKKLLALP